MRGSFWNLVQKGKPDECWSWLGYRLKKNGKLTYGQLTVAGHTHLAHRFSFWIRHGLLPANLFICHKCNNPACVNPDHLYVADNARNIKDAWRDGLIVSGNSKKPRCPKCGADYSVYPNQNGRRYCKRCKQDWQNRKRARLRAMSQTKEKE